MKPLGLKVEGGLKQNLRRISQKIQENKNEKEGPFRVTDMVRATIVCETSQ